MHAQTQTPDNWKLRLFLDNIYRMRIQQQFDQIVPVVGDEGLGKSTLMLEAVWLWQDIRGQTPDVDSVLDQVVWDQDGFKQAMANYEPQSAIPVQDAARVLYKKEAMQSDQKELEKDLLDSRMKEFLILLGFQDWSIIPTMLQERRAKTLLRIPSRGVVYGYSRESIDEKVETGEWPEPDMRAQFPSLDGTDLWDEFKAQDREQKESRIDLSDDGDGGEELSVKEVAAEIKDEGVSAYLSTDRRSGDRYVDDEIIQVEYPYLSIRKARQVRKLLERDDEVVSRIESENGGVEVDA